MAGGWTRDGAVQDQIDDSVKDAIEHARALLPTGEGAISSPREPTHCSQREVAMSALPPELSSGVPVHPCA